MSQQSPRYRRILLKLSGESLAGNQPFGIDATALSNVIQQISLCKKMGVEVGVVIGGGNLFRGEKLTAEGFDRISADQIGMLSTVMNGLALRAALSKANHKVKLFSSISMPGMVDIYDRTAALAALNDGEIVIFTAGVGTPLFSTDSAASLRAIEMQAEILLKASTVDGVYSADPKKDPSAKRFDQLDYHTVIVDQLRVMDLTAICLCRDNKMPLIVFDMNKPHALENILQGKVEGTLIS